MADQLTGRVVAITGAARGIGFATARAFLAGGAKVAIADIDEVALKSAASELEGEVFTGIADVTDPESLRGFLDDVEDALGPVDVMVNNAGIMPTGPLLEESDEIAQRTIDINVIGVITGTKRALESMVARRTGVVVNLASAAGVAPAPGLATYNASKFGALGFSLAADLEFRNEGVRVVAILPSVVNTELTSGMGKATGIRTVEPEEVAAAIVRAARDPGSSTVFVPNQLKYIHQFAQLLPEVAQRGLLRLLGAERLAVDFDRNARRAYHERIGR